MQKQTQQTRCFCLQHIQQGSGLQGGCGALAVNIHHKAVIYRASCHVFALPFQHLRNLWEDDKKSETKLTADIRKEDQNTQKVRT